MKKENKDKQIDFEPDWITKTAKSMLQEHKESYGDEDQNNLMDLIESNNDDQL